ncbi:helix-turn-helix transcriptional regulator [uncultured Ramlibacter sp.]|uniref:helix-turn-helix transcriptional regulator n=1 Tax=uncultured Ramlibacter sp. TaxID=260755 RepID=UPI002606C3AD|nr:helix-turn-helix transcriptional regulator [uncultured Ramlibacter sp.]
MRKWNAASGPCAAAMPGQALAGMIEQLGQPQFQDALLEQLHPLVPAASWSVYQVGAGCEPRLFLSASRGVPDTTRACWQAYLSGPYLGDRTLARESAAADETLLCHIAACEVPAEHRARVYEAHGVAERVSVVRQQGGVVFAVNFYRHLHQRPYSDGQIAQFESLAPALLALVQKHVALAPPLLTEEPLAAWRRKLALLEAGLTGRELDVCARLLRGMTQEGIAADLGLGLPTVKTYRNRAFARLGIHFRNQLFALLAGQPRLH